MLRNSGHLLQVSRGAARVIRMQGLEMDVALTILGANVQQIRGLAAEATEEQAAALRAPGQVLIDAFPERAGPSSSAQGAAPAAAAGRCSAGSSLLQRRALAP